MPTGCCHPFQSTI
uniref:Uncharacterized protein n=1 Tax=Arundo donax TaxID=35708 RepID=A0A0A9AA61_ARUDO